VKKGKTSSYNADPEHVSLKILPPARDKKKQIRDHSAMPQKKKKPRFCNQCIIM
jgi:hypothetical protein